MAAKKGNKYAKGNSGNKTLYKKEYAEEAYGLCLLGFTDDQLAEYYHVTPQTINNWKKAHKDFFESLRKGKVIADVTVAKSFFKRCNGMKITEEKLDSHGEIIELQKELPPDTGAITRWLASRQRNLWCESSKLELTGKDGGPIELTRSERQARLKELLGDIDDEA